MRQVSSFIWSVALLPGLALGNAGCIVGRVVPVGEHEYSEPDKETEAGEPRDAGGELSAVWRVDSAIAGTLEVEAMRRVVTPTRVRVLRRWTQRWERRVSPGWSTACVLFCIAGLGGLGWLLFNLVMHIVNGSLGKDEEQYNWYPDLVAASQKSGSDVIEDWKEDPELAVVERQPARCAVHLSNIANGPTSRTDQFGRVSFSLPMADGWLLPDGIAGPPALKDAARALARPFTVEIRAPSIGAATSCEISELPIDELAGRAASAFRCQWTVRVVDARGVPVRGATVELRDHHPGDATTALRSVEPDALRERLRFVLAEQPPPAASQRGVTGQDGAVNLVLPCLAPSGRVTIAVWHPDLASPIEREVSHRLEREQETIKLPPR